MDWLARKAAEASRAQDVYRTIHHDKILSAAYRWLEGGEGDFGLFGHFHVPYAEARRDGKVGGIYSLDCWDQPNFLLVRNGDFFRLRSELESASELVAAEYNKNGSGRWSLMAAQSYFADAKVQAEKPDFVPALISSSRRLK